VSWGYGTDQVSFCVSGGSGAVLSMKNFAFNFFCKSSNKLNGLDHLYLCIISIVILPNKLSCICISLLMLMGFSIA